MLQDETEEYIQVFKEARNLANSVVRCQNRLTKKKAVEDIENEKLIPDCFSSNVNRSKKDTNRETAPCLTMMVT